MPSFRWALMAAASPPLCLLLAMSADSGVTGLGFESCLHCGVAVCLRQLTSLLRLSYSTCKMGGSEDSEGRGVRGACHRGSAGDWGLAVAAVFIVVTLPLWEALSQSATAQSRLDSQETSLVARRLRLFTLMQGAPGQGIRSHTMPLRVLMP